LEALYTPDYPDVVAISRKIADLAGGDCARSAERRLPWLRMRPAKPHDSPQLQQLKFSSRRAAGHGQCQAGAGSDQQQIRTYEAKIEASPMIEEEYKQVTRDHETALAVLQHPADQDERIVHGNSS
jgi:hypothetical protein